MGRHREMSALQAALDDARSGRGQIVMLVGEPGIGKTSTAREFTDYAVSQGARVAWGRCYESIGMPSYWPWVQAIRSYVRDQDPAQLRLEMGTGAGEIAEIVPEVREMLPGLEPSPGLDSLEHARLRLFDSITSFLERASLTRPLVFVLDNLHWADRPSLLLLEFLSQEIHRGQLMVVGTYRDEEISQEHPLFHTLGELTKGQHFRRVHLRGLTEENVDSLMRHVSGVPPAQELVEAVYRQTQGNPLFVTEVVRLLAQEQKLTQDPIVDGVAENLGIPDGVREAIGRRLYRLSDACNRVLAIGSVVGREFGMAQLERLVPDLLDPEILALLEEALAARIIEELPHAIGRYQFTHVLVQETLASNLSAARRSILHREIGEALEDAYSGNLAVHAAELAHHFARVEAGDIDEKFVQYSVMAGEQALAGYAFEDALAHFQRGLAIKEGQAIDQEYAELLFGFSRASGATGQLRDAWAASSRAFDYFMDEGNVAAAVAVAKYPLLFTSGLPHVTHMVTRALTLVADNSLNAGYLLSRFGLLLNLETGDYLRAQEFLAKALLIAQSEGDVSLEIQALSNAADVAWYRMSGPKVLENSSKAIELARGIDDPQAESCSRFLAAFVQLASGNHLEARRHAGEMLSRVESLRDRSLLTQAYLINMHVSRLVGDWESAREFSDRGLALSPRHSWLLGLRSILEFELGDFELGETYLQRTMDVMLETAPGPNESEYQTPAWAIPTIRRITGDSGRFGLAEEAARSVLSYPSCTLRLSSLRFALALIPVVRNDAADAELRYNDLVPLRDSVMSGDPLTIGMATMDRVFGLLAATMCQFDQAVKHFDDAISFCEGAGYRPELAWACCDCADTLIQRKAAGDRQRADSLVSQATMIASELGMKPLLDRLIANKLGAKAEPDKSPDYPRGLSHREVEVLRLLAAGDSNREIAAGLVLSVRTVERHVANIYNKTDSRGRAEATAFAITNGLTTST